MVLQLWFEYFLCSIWRTKCDVCFTIKFFFLTSCIYDLRSMDAAGVKYTYPLKMSDKSRDYLNLHLLIFKNIHLVSRIFVFTYWL